MSDTTHDTGDRILLAHGGGGRLSREWIEETVLPLFASGPLRGLPDAATLGPFRNAIFTTDSFVVQPCIFPGGTIGELAVHGTVNDLAVSGAEPRWLSLALIVEEGFSLRLLRRILEAVRDAAAECGVGIATGDTKVVGRGQCDGVYINTAGLGDALPGFRLGPDRIRPGDSVLVSGSLAEHGFAVLAAREGVLGENGPVSDSAPVHRLVASLGGVADGVRFMRDPTRGGLASVLTELVAGRSVGIVLDEACLPLSPGVKAASELLGMDPLHVASEGRVVAVCSPDIESSVLTAWRGLPEGQGAVKIGTVSPDEEGCVVLETLTGGHRLVDVPHGELLPRIC